MKSFYLLFPFLAFAFCSIAQGNRSLTDAERYFGIRNYEEALPLYLKGIESGERDPIVHYKTGVCYEKSVEIDQQIKAIPYFEYALKNTNTLPASVYYDLGNLYLKDENLEKAIDSFTKFRDRSNKSDKKAMALAEQALDKCSNAVVFMSVPRNTKVTRMNSIVNTRYTEYNPVVSADEGVLAFTALRPNTGKTRSGDKFIEEIYISYNQSGSWTEPVVVPVASDFNVGTAGISPDGQRMMIFMGGINDPGSIFMIDRAGESWSKPSLLANTINTPKYLESTASITPDGKVLYFASDRLGGQGGLDIYKIERKDDGSWTSPANLGAAVNTPDNEDAPFIHPDQRTLFFTSDGHNSMGGRDIFKTMQIDGHWTRPDALLVSFCLASVAALLPITPGGLGVMEVTLSAALVGFGVPRGIALLGVVSWRLVNYWLPIPVGAAAYVSLHIGRPGRPVTEELEELTDEARLEAGEVLPWRGGRPPRPT